MSALSVKPSHKAQSMLLGPPCVYLCRQEGSEPTRTTTSTYPSIQSSFSNHLFSLSISAVLFIPSTPCCDIFYAVADASCFAWYAYLHPPAAHPQMLWFFLCVCVLVFVLHLDLKVSSEELDFFISCPYVDILWHPLNSFSSRCSLASSFFIGATYFCQPVLKCHVSPHDRLVLTVACWSCLVLIAF